MRGRDIYAIATIRSKEIVAIMAIRYIEKYSSRLFLLHDVSNIGPDAELYSY